jgi:hypothetical protein
MSDPLPAAPVPSHDAAPARRAPPWLGRALVEGALLAASVGLGLAANEWAQARDRRERATVALRAVREELSVNARAARRAATHHDRVRTLLDSLLRAGLPAPESVYYGGMYQPARFLTSAWESARTTDVLGALPYDLVLALSATYAREREYVELSSGLVRELYADQMRRGGVAVYRDAAPQWVLLLGDWTGRERWLAAGADSAMARVDAALARR